MREVTVHRVILEEILLFPTSVVHRHILHDVLLAAVDDADKAEFERIGPASKHVERVGACVHEVQLGEHTERPQSAGVDRPRQLQRVRVGQVHIRRRHSQDHPAWISTIPEALDVLLTRWAWKYSRERGS